VARPSKIGTNLLEDEALRRGKDGGEEPHFYEARLGQRAEAFRRGLRCEQ